MKKIYIVTIILMSQISIAQINATVKYKSILQKNGRAPIYELLNIQGSFTTYQLLTKALPEKVVTNDKTGITTINRKNNKEIHPFIYMNLLKKEIISIVGLTEDDGDTYKRFKVIETFSIKWKLSNETMKIKNFDCKKATTTFRGRNYNAWYASSIPIPAGPFKFVGLPGLILQIADDKNEVAFYAEEIKIPVKQLLKTPEDIFKENIQISEFILKWKIADKKSELALRSKLIAKFPIGTSVELSDDDTNDIEKFNR
jgi:GLPGLI family protein